MPIIAIPALIAIVSKRSRLLANADAGYFPLTFLNAALILCCHPGPSASQKIQHVAVDAQGHLRIFGQLSALHFLQRLAMSALSLALHSLLFARPT